MNTLRCGLALFPLVAALAVPAFDAHSQDWNIQVVANTGYIGYGSQIAVTSDGIPYILDSQSTTYDLFLRWWVPSGGGLGSWETINIDKALYSDTMEMVADSSDRLHMSWTNVNTDSVMYAVFDGPSKSWYRSPVGITGATTADVDLAIFEDGGVIRPTIAYNKNNKLYVATKDPVAGTWSFETVYDTGSVQYVSVAADSVGAIHIAFYETIGDDLMYATNAHGSWTIEYVDITGNVGDYCSIVIEPGNIPYIAYYDQTNTDLRYARLIPE